MRCFIRKDASLCKNASSVTSPAVPRHLLPQEKAFCFTSRHNLIVQRTGRHHAVKSQRENTVGRGLAPAAVAHREMRSSAPLHGMRNKSLPCVRGGDSRRPAEGLCRDRLPFRRSGRAPYSESPPKGTLFSPAARDF